MGWEKSEIIVALSYLLPGFLAAWAFHSLSGHTKPNPFERVIQALIYTMLVQALVVSLEGVFLLVGKHGFAIGDWSEDVRLVWSVLIALGMGTTFAYFANTGKLHSFLSRRSITKETSHPSEWYATFNERETFIVLHLDGNRRLYGWPVDWPSDPNAGHFSISNAEWLLEDGVSRLELTNVDVILIPTSEVKMVEFMNRGDTK